MSKYPKSASSSSRPFPTLRSLLRGGGKSGRSTRAPWFSGYPTRARSAWAQCYKKKT